MSNKRPQWQLQALAAQRRDLEMQRAEQRQKVAQYFETNTRASRHHEQWTTDGYYERANKEAVLLSERKIRAAKLEERRKKLELMLFQENMQYQQELKTLTSKPKLFKNGSEFAVLENVDNITSATQDGHLDRRISSYERNNAIDTEMYNDECCILKRSYLNDVPTSTLQDINQGIMAKEEQMRKQEAELQLYHSWRAKQPELRAAESYIRNGKLKSAWMEQIVEKEVKKKQEEEHERRVLLERDESLRRQIQVEQERLKEKELQISDLRQSLEGQILELSEKEKAVKALRQQEERQRLILEELKFIRRERESKHKKLAAERDANIVNMGLHKYKLKLKVLAVVKEIELELDMLDRLRSAVLQEYKDKESKCGEQKRVLDEAGRQLVEFKEKEKLRQKNIDTMYDGEARQLNDKQDKLWEKERQARALLMEEVLAALQRQTEEKIEASRQRQKENVLEREQILDQVDTFHKDVRNKETEKQFQGTTYGNITQLQTQLKGLEVQQRRLEEKVAQDASVRDAIAHEERLRKELVRMHREGVADLPTGRRTAW